MDIKYELNLTDYWRIMRKRQWIILACFLAVFISSIIFTNLQTPLYQASSGIRIVERAAVASVQQYFYQSYQTDRMASQEKMITSQAVLENAARRLGMVSEDSSKEEKAEASATIGGMIETDREGMTDLIWIIASSSDPAQAANVANAIAEAFQEVDLAERKKQASTIREFIEEQLVMNGNKLYEAEEALRDFKESGRASGIGVTLDAQLSELQQRRLELLKRYTGKHPDVKTVDEQIAALREHIALLPDSELELSRLQREVEVNEKTYRMMKEKYEEARIAEAEEIGDVRIVNYATVPGAPVSPNKMLNRMVGALIGLMLGVFGAFVVESLDTSIGTIEDVESIVKVSVLGVVPFLTRAGEEQPLWRRPLVPLLKYIDRFRKPEEVGLSNLIIHQGSSSALAEAFRVLRTYVMLEAPKEGCELLMVTSAGPREGKTLVCSNIAIAIAQTGANVLLVDADFRRSMIHKLFGVPRQPGLSDLLLGKATEEECVRSLVDILTGHLDWDATLQTKGLDHLSILTSGTSVAMASELLDQDKLRSLFDSLRAHYDFIILDSPPVAPVSDSIVLGAIADRVIFVYQAGKTDKRMLVRTIDECKMGGLNVTGIILNYATAGVQLSAPPYYYQSKYKYESQENKKK